MRPVLLICAACAAMSLSTAVNAQHAGDIFLAIENETIVTGAIDDQQNITTPVRVFAAQFGDSGCAPFTANPGFDTLPGMFPTGTQLGWNAVDGLKVWNGGGFDPVDTEFFDVSYISLSATVGAAPASGFALFVQSDGGFHRHLDFCMNGCPSGCGAPMDADPGVYLLSLELYSSDAGIKASAPFWIVFNYLSTPGNHDAAVTWALANLVDEPACPADIVANSAVDVFDLLELLSNWGTNGAGAAIAPPETTVDVFDLLGLLDAWGACSP